MLDVNCPWSVGEALAMNTRLAHLNLMWLEEPIWPPEKLSRSRPHSRRTQSPNCRGENAGSLHDFAAMIDAGAIDIAQPDVAKPAASANS